jgi:hypothetical protein
MKFLGASIEETTMRITSALVFVLCAALAAPAFADSPFVGKWTATATTPGGGVSETVTVVMTADGYAITGKLVVPPPEGTPEGGPGRDIVLDGDRFSYQRKVTVPGGEIVITYTGVVSGDTFTGEAEIAGLGKTAYNGVRIK